MVAVIVRSWLAAAHRGPGLGRQSRIAGGGGAILPCRFMTFGRCPAPGARPTVWSSRTDRRTPRIDRRRADQTAGCRTAAEPAQLPECGGPIALHSPVDASAAGESVVSGRCQLAEGAAVPDGAAVDGGGGGASVTGGRAA